MANNLNKIIFLKSNNSVGSNNNFQNIPLNKVYKPASNFTSQSMTNFSTRTDFENGFLVQSVPCFSRNKFSKRNSKVHFVDKNKIHSRIVAFRPEEKVYNVKNVSDSITKNVDPFDFNDQFVVSTTSFQDVIEIPRALLVYNVTSKNRLKK